MLQTRRGDEWKRESCLDEMAVANVVDGGVDASAPPDLIAHLASCTLCREQVASVARLLRETSIATDIRRVENRSASPVMLRWRIAGAGSLAALAAAAVFMVVGSGDRTPPSQALSDVASDETHRQQSVTTTTAPHLLAPVGAVATADTFRWTSVPRANRYRVTLFQRDGTVAWESEARDTALALPKSIALAGMTAYLWKVEARTEKDRWVASELIEFSIPRSRRVPE